jgi:hypothetical protein
MSRDAIAGAVWVPITLLADVAEGSPVTHCAFSTPLFDPSTTSARIY